MSAPHERPTGQDRRDPCWLQELAGMQARGEILPGGMVWETPPPARAAALQFMNRLTEVACDASAIPMEVRRKMVRVLYANPGRWARVYDGGRAQATAASSWFGKQLGGRLMQVTERRMGATVAVFACYCGSGRR